MRKCIIFSVTISLILMLCACHKAPGTPTKGNPIQEKPSATEPNPSKSDISSVALMKYPVLYNENHDFSLPNNTIKTILDQKAASLLDNTSEITVFSSDYTVTLQSSEYISILYKLYVNIKGTAHPTDAEFGINTDMEGKPLTLQDILPLDQTFVTQFKAAWNEQCEETLLNYLDDYTDEALLALLQESNSAASDISFYLTEDGVTILFPVPRAVGSYVHIQLKTEEKTGDGFA